MDISSQFAKNGFVAQSFVATKLRLMLPSEFEVIESRSYLWGQGVRGSRLNFEEKIYGDIRIYKKGCFIASVEVCSGAGHGLSLGESKDKHFSGTHYCFVLLGEDVQSCFVQSHPVLVFAPRETMSRYLSTMPLKESKFAKHEKYRWFSPNNLVGLRCGQTAEAFVQILLDHKIPENEPVLSLVTNEAVA